MATINLSLSSVDLQTASNFLHALQTYQSGEWLLKCWWSQSQWIIVLSRGSQETVHLDVENELREAMSDTIKDDGKILFSLHPTSSNFIYPTSVILFSKNLFCLTLNLAALWSMIFLSLSQYNLFYPTIDILFSQQELHIVLLSFLYFVNCISEIAKILYKLVKSIFAKILCHSYKNQTTQYFFLNLINNESV